VTMKIAIADTNTLRRDMIATALVSSGYDVMSVASPNELGLLPDKPDLAVVDASYIPNLAPTETDELSIDIKKRVIKLNGEPLKLTPKEYALLAFLMSHRGQVFTRDELFSHVWECSEYSDTRAVMVYIGRIRKKIEKNPTAPELLLNVWGSGYMLVA